MMSKLLRVFVLALVLGSSGCKDGAASSENAPSPSTEVVFGGARPLDFFRVPAGYDAAKPAPLLLVLHGYGAGGSFQNSYFHFNDIADAEGLFIAAPDGTVNGVNRRFWNATDACCDFEKSGVDDVRYLTGLIREIKAAYSIDPKRIYVVGHSNGGAMAYRLACDASDQIAAVVSLAGPFYADAKKCAPTSPVAIQHMHGTADSVVPFEGGKTASVHPNATSSIPSAESIVSTWAGFDKCTAAPALDAAPIDADGNVPGAETKVTRFGGCSAGSEVVLWTMAGSSHIPALVVADFPSRIYAFLKAHPKL